jgi:hypothetical protein
MPPGEPFPDRFARLTGVRCDCEIACNPQFLEAGLGSSRSAQTMAPKTHVLEAMRDKSGRLSCWTAESKMQ